MGGRQRDRQREARQSGVERNKEGWNEIILGGRQRVRENERE